MTTASPQASGRLAIDRDFRDFLRRLEAAGKLRRVRVPVDKDWELAAVTRRTFQRVPEAARPALLFEVAGFDIPVAVGVLGGSRDIYSLALGVPIDEIADCWARAQASPIEPVVVDSGVCQEVVQTGAAVDLYALPIPTWTVGHDPAPYITAGCVVSKDPVTGVRNVGTYRLQLKGRNRLGLFVGKTSKGIWSHIEQNEAHNRPTPIAIVLGAVPAIGLCSVAAIRPGLDEFAVAGALRGEPLELVRGCTVDVEVPATTEIVLEGHVLPNVREHEGPFGDYTGYVDPAGENHVVEITAITHRRNPIYHAFFSQMPPSESSTIRSAGREAAIYKHLTKDLKLPVKDVHLLHAGGAAAILAISIYKKSEAMPQHVMWGAWSVDPTLGKFTIVVDDDIDVRDEFALNWALSWRVQPARDIQIHHGTPPTGLDPSQQAGKHLAGDARDRHVSSKVGIDATRKHAYPALAVPPAEHLARVDAEWERYGILPNH